jgi:hypothetical protein
MAIFVFIHFDGRVDFGIYKSRIPALYSALINTGSALTGNTILGNAAVKIEFMQLEFFLFIEIIIVMNYRNGYDISISFQ